MVKATKDLAYLSEFLESDRTQYKGMEIDNRNEKRPRRPRAISGGASKKSSKKSTKKSSKKPSKKSSKKPSKKSSKKSSKKASKKSSKKASKKH